MTPRAAKRTERNGNGFLKRLAQWHRALGLAAALFVLLLAVTGVMLNHTDALQLDKRYVRAEWLLDWYGIAPASAPVSFAAGAQRVTEIDDRLYLDARAIPGRYGRLVGAARLPHVVVAAFNDALVLLTPEGDIVEIVRADEGLPAGTRAVAVDRGTLRVLAAHGVYATDEGVTRWRPVRATAVAWARPMSLPPPLKARLVALYRGQGLSVERVLRDLHSGRLFGRFGPFAMDLAAAALLLLAATGVWLWSRRKKN